MYKEPISFKLDIPEDGPYLIHILELIKRAGMDFDLFMGQAVFDKFDRLEAQLDAPPLKPGVPPANDNTPPEGYDPFYGCFTADIPDVFKLENASAQEAIDALDD